MDTETQDRSYVDTAVSPLHSVFQGEAVVPPVIPALTSFEFDASGRRGGPAIDKGLGQANMGGSIINLTNTIVGGGILALPFAFASSGFLLGTFFLLLFGVAAFFGLHLLTLCAFELGLPSSFRKVTSKALPGWSNFIDAIVAFKCFGVATSYLVVIGDTTTSLFGGQREAWVLFGAFCTAPLCFMANIDGLKFTSAVSLAFIVYLTFMVVILAAMSPAASATHEEFFPLINATDLDNATAVTTNSTSLAETFTSSSTTLASFNGVTMANLTVFVFGFTCHQNILPVANELRRSSPRRVSIVSAASIGAAFAFYLMVAVAGYATFGDQVQSDVLSSYSDNDGNVAIFIARAAVALLVCFSYPLQCQPSRICIISLVKNAWPQLAEGETNEVWLRHGVTAVFLFLSTVIALLVTDLGIVLGVVGATGSAMVSYVIPGASYVRIFPQPHLLRTLAFVQLGTGFLITPLALVGIALRATASE